MTSAITRRFSRQIRKEERGEGRGGRKGKREKNGENKPPNVIHVNGTRSWQKFCFVLILYKRKKNERTNTVNAIKRLRGFVNLCKKCVNACDRFYILIIYAMCSISFFVRTSNTREDTFSASMHMHVKNICCELVNNYICALRV